ncbi:MAG: 2-hydroxyacid dehydrogenase [Candidatus Sedimenticola sp. (ex Thyasira tokunagai)]
MKRAKAVFLDHKTVDLGDLDLTTLKETPYDWHFYPKGDAQQTLERIQGAEVAITNKVVLDRQLLSQAHDLKLICIIATGTNNVDLEAAAKLGIAVTNVTAYGTSSVVQHVFSLILALTTRLNEYQAAVKRGDWQRSDMFCLLDFPIREISEKTLGIVGYGELGKATGRIAEAFGMKLLIAQRPGGKTQAGRIPLKEMLPQVDILSLHCPLTNATRDLIGREELALMRSDALLINTARGGIVDEQALVEALRQGRLGGAGFDVLTQEPPANDNPLLQQDIPRLILTPHNAWGSRESRQRLVDKVVENITAYRRGEKRNRVV